NCGTRTETLEGQTSYPYLDGAGMGQGRVNHLEGHDLGQLAQMSRRGGAAGDTDLTIKVGSGRMNRQRSSRGREASWSMPSLPELRCPTSDDTPNARLL